MKTLSDRVVEVVGVLAVCVLLPVAAAAGVGVLCPEYAGEARGAGGTLSAVLTLASLYGIWEG